MKTSKKQRGVAAVEFALILGPMLIAVFGITELGRALFQYNALVKGSRDAVRYLAQQDLGNLDESTTPKLSEVRARTIALAVCGKPSCADEFPLVPDLTAAKVTLCDYLNDPTSHNNVLTGEGTVDLVTVRIGSNCSNVQTQASTVHFTSLVSWVIPNIDFSTVKTTMASRYF
jgi:Flp pilus assembly protein TadG